MGNFFLKRIYEPYDESDGCRILIDRLWPRGMSKEEAKLSHWFKEIAPSNELRKWFGHRPEFFEEFRTKYLNELHGADKKIELIHQIIDIASKEKVTLLFSTKNLDNNHAIVLRDELIKTMKNGK